MAWDSQWNWKQVEGLTSRLQGPCSCPSSWTCSEEWISWSPRWRVRNVVSDEQMEVPARSPLPLHSLPHWGLSCGGWVSTISSWGRNSAPETDWLIKTYIVVTRRSTALHLIKCLCGIFIFSLPPSSHPSVYTPLEAGPLLNLKFSQYHAFCGNWINFFKV